jgi:DNA-binding phage protein
MNAPPAVLLIALRRVARAHGMAEKTFSETLSETESPTLATARMVLHAVGLRLSVAPIAAGAGTP